MARENFSFRRVLSDTYQTSTDSPPLWNLSTPKEKNGTEDGRDHHFEPRMITHGPSRRFSYVERGRKSIREDGGSSGGSQEDKMDLLWADFNEESSPRRGSDPPLTVAKANMHAVLSSKNRLSMVAVVKILGKFFSFKNQGKARERALR